MEESESAAGEAAAAGPGLHLGRLPTVQQAVRHLPAQHHHRCRHALPAVPGQGSDVVVVFRTALDVWASPAGSPAMSIEAVVVTQTSL